LHAHNHSFIYTHKNTHIHKLKHANLFFSKQIKAAV
jgi:hypothetical protein